MANVIEKRAQSIVPPTAGGYVVPEEATRLFWEIVLSDRLLAAITLYEEPNGQSNSIVIEDQQSTGSWVAENGAITPIDTVFANIPYINLPKVVAAAQSSIELLDDALASGSPGRAIVDRILANRLRRTMRQAIAIGSGTGQPLGLFTVAAALPVQVVGIVSRGNIYDLIGGIHPSHLESPNCAWVMSPSTWTTVVDVGTSGWINGSDKLMLLGFPVILNAYAPTNEIVFGNLAYYGMKRIPELMSGTIVNSASNALNGQATQYVWTRMYGTPVVSASSDPALGILKPV